MILRGQACAESMPVYVRFNNFLCGDEMWNGVTMNITCRWRSSTGTEESVWNTQSIRHQSAIRRLGACEG